MKKTIKLSASGLRKIIEGIVKEEAQLATPELHPAWDTEEDLGTTVEDGPEDAHTDFSSLTAPVKATGMSGPSPYAAEFDSACGCSSKSPVSSAIGMGPMPPKGPTSASPMSDFDTLTMTVSKVEPAAPKVDDRDGELLLDEEPVDDKTFAAKEKGAKEHGMKNPGGFVAAALKRLGKR